MRGSGYPRGWNISGQFAGYFNEAQPLLKVNDGRNALLMLEAVMEPFVECWFEYDEDGEVGQLFEDIGPLFTEAVLCADLSDEEKKSWLEKLSAWQDEVDEYGIDSVFEPAMLALRRGLGRPLPQDALRDEITDEEGVWDDEVTEHADALTLVRLHLLEREGRFQEYLELAEAEGQFDHYLTMLVKLDRSEEAVELALEHLVTVDEAEMLALALDEKGLTDEALEIAEHGLTLEGYRDELSRWLRDKALEHGNTELALEGALVAFNDSLTLQSYLAVESLAGADWETLKPDLLAQVADDDLSDDKVGIYLQEGMLTEAMKEIDDYEYWGSSIIENVVDAVYQEFPDWAIKYCKQEAEPDMDAGNSEHYRDSVHWVKKTGEVYLAAKRSEEWREYLEGLITKHHRKRSLRPRLEELRKLK